MQAEEKFLSSLDKAKKSLEIADHLAYMTFPIVRENKLLLKILEELYNSIISAINSILQYEYTYKRIRLYTNAKENFNTFRSIAGRYKIDKEQLGKIINILTLAEIHKNASLEFAKNDKIVIMSDNLKTETLTIDKIKAYLLETKDFLRKCSLVITH